MAWVFVVEGLVTGLLPGLGRWLPSGAAQALSGSGDPRLDLLPVWTGGLLLLAYAGGLSFVGSRILVRSDIA